MTFAPNPLTAYYPAIRERISAQAGACEWPAFAEEVAVHLARPLLPPPALLPVAAAAAVGGDPARALPVSAAFGFLVIAVRWFDDTQDRDRDHALWARVGAARASNFAAAALNLAWRTLVEAPELPRSVLVAFGQETTALARGQDDDLCGVEAVSFEAYWRRIEQKSGSGFATACRLGALAGRDEPAPAAALARFGRHLGTMVQILDDLDGVFHPDGLGDLALGKVTLPVLYGLAADHGGRDELRRIVRAGRLAAEAPRVRELLDGTDTRSFLVWSAFEERDRAFAALGELGSPAEEIAELGSAAGEIADLEPPAGEVESAGRAALAAVAGGLIADWEELLVRGPAAEPAPMVAERTGYFAPRHGETGP